jgi:phage tail sheath protein FI
MADYTLKLGARVSYGVLYDALDVFFREGGAKAFVSRVVGPAATTGFKNLLDNVAATSLVVSAIGPGAYSTGLKVAVSAGIVDVAKYIITITDVNNIVLETSPEFPDQQSAVDWAKGSNYVRIALGASALNPVVAAAAALSAGNDDRASIVDANWATSLARFTKDLGPGNVSYPGRTTAVAHGQLLTHCDTLGIRKTFIDMPDTPTQATLTAVSAPDRATLLGKHGAAFAPWIVVPGIAAGTYRTIPPSALAAGRAAAVDRQFNANVPAAGELGQASYALDVSQPAWDALTRDTLNKAGVNVIRNIYGDVRIYGWRSLADPNTEPQWLDFGNSRLNMQIAALADVIAEQYVLKQLDGQGITVNAFGGALKGMLIPFHTEGALYGVTPDEAFYVDVGPTVNTPTRIANNELRAVISLKMSPFAELVMIEVVKVGLQEGVI